MACLGVKLTKPGTALPPSLNGSGGGGGGASGGAGDGGKQKEVQAARRGLLKAMWEASVAPRFSSKPIDMEGYFGGNGSSFISDGTSSVGGGASLAAAANDFRSSLVASSNLTPNEREYLENLLRSDDLDSIRRASIRLADKELFPPTDDDDHNEDGKEAKEDGEGDHNKNHRNHKVLARRDSEVQQQLFRLHEQTTVKPSAVIRRLSIHDSQSKIPEQSDENSIAAGASWDVESEDATPQPSVPPGPSNSKKWNPLVDVSSWIDGKQGIEVDDDGTPEIPYSTSNPFKILGTSADDVSCHPHVLSPPLMEGLQAFMPESLQEHHYWLKYSMARDGPNLMTMLRHCRGSTHTVLAIETTDGHVFGAYTSQPWRLGSGRFHGNMDSFVWRMRQSRNVPCRSILEQVLMESKIDVFPFTGKNSKIQRCTKTGIVLGEGEVKDTRNMGGNHLGHAILLDASMTKGSTSTTETFGNPSLVTPGIRGEEFLVANVELWALTPHSNEEAAVRAEMKMLFIEECRSTEKNLNLIEILVGSPP